MKLFNFKAIALLAFVVFSMASCKSDEKKSPGDFSILFDTKLADKTITIQEPGNKTYQYTDSKGQEINISKFAYYISEIELLGEKGVVYNDPLNVSANADEVKGYYHVTNTNASSKVINLKNVTAGSYNKIRFTIGINESGVKQGAAGGVLDPANGAWFWNWNSGYIGFGVEGNASTSGQDYIDWGNGNETQAGTFAIHVGGWKDIEPKAGETKKFVNNIKVIEIDFGTTVQIEKGLHPKAHLNVDLSKFLKDTDFATTFAVHAPILGKPFSEKLKDVFELDHIHQ